MVAATRAVREKLGASEGGVQPGGLAWGDEIGGARDRAGPRTAVLIHGIMSDSRAWHRVTGELEQRGFRVIAVDLAGHGRSPRAGATRRAWADDVVETLQPS